VCHSELRRGLASGMDPGIWYRDSSATRFVPRWDILAQIFPSGARHRSYSPTGGRCRESIFDGGTIGLCGCRLVRGGADPGHSDRRRRRAGTQVPPRAASATTAGVRRNHRRADRTPDSLAGPAGRRADTLRSCRTRDSNRPSPRRSPFGLSLRVWISPRIT